MSRAYRKRRYRKGFDWSPEEEQLLIDGYATERQHEEIAAALGRTKGTIQRKAMRLGLTTPEFREARAEALVRKKYKEA